MLNELCTPDNFHAHIITVVHVFTYTFYIGSNLHFLFLLIKDCEVYYWKHRGGKDFKVAGEEGISIRGVSWYSLICKGTCKKCFDLLRFTTSLFDDSSLNLLQLNHWYSYRVVLLWMQHGGWMFGGTGQINRSWSEIPVCDLSFIRSAGKF